MSGMLLDVSFLGFAGLVVVTSVLVVALKNLLHAAVALFFCLTGVAALYVLLGADFLAVAQLLIYAGGILVLIIFGVFLTARIYGGTKLEVTGSKMPWKFGLAVAFGVFMATWTILSKATWRAVEPKYAVTTKELGNLFLTKYVLAFELISILLLFVMVGAAVLVRKEMEKVK
jgi:NADH:ubiquinone oxidoreductase subunit 6 (subunit J)